MSTTTMQARGRATTGGGDEGGDAPKKVTTVTITPPNMQLLRLTIRGTAPLVINRFGQKAMEMMKAKHEAGSTARKGRGNREAKDFAALYEGARHRSPEGWDGIHAAAFRKAMVSACRLVGFKMTLAKLALSIDADGFDKVDGVPLVKITKGKPQKVEHFVRNETGVADIRPRAMFEPGWEATLRVRYDGDMFTAQDVVNLLARVGEQVGVGEGRPDSPNSTGMGWGLFKVCNSDD